MIYIEISCVIYTSARKPLILFTKPAQHIEFRKIVFGQLCFFYVIVLVFWTSKIVKQKKTLIIRRQP